MPINSEDCDDCTNNDKHYDSCTVEELENQVSGLQHRVKELCAKKDAAEVKVVELQKDKKDLKHKVEAAKAVRKSELVKMVRAYRSEFPDDEADEARPAVTSMIVGA